MKDDIEFLRGLANCEDKEQMMRYIQDQETKTMPLPFDWPVCGHKTDIPMTNADRIRAMSDEELANWLARTQYANMMEATEIFGAQLPFDEETLKGSEKECLEWLQQPAEGE